MQERHTGSSGGARAPQQQPCESGAVAAMYVSHGGRDARGARQQRCESALQQRYERATAPASQVRVARQQRCESTMYSSSKGRIKGRTPQPQRGERGTAAAMRERHAPHAAAKPERHSSSDARAPQQQRCDRECHNRGDARAPWTCSRSHAGAVRQQRGESGTAAATQGRHSSSDARAPCTAAAGQERHWHAQQQRSESGTAAAMRGQHGSSEASYLGYTLGTLQIYFGYTSAILQIYFGYT